MGAGETDSTVRKRTRMGYAPEPEPHRAETPSLYVCHTYKVFTS
jgi:hypothetical protein